MHGIWWRASFVHVSPRRILASFFAVRCFVTTGVGTRTRTRSFVGGIDANGKRAGIHHRAGHVAQAKAMIEGQGVPAILLSTMLSLNKQETRGDRPLSTLE